MTNTAVIRPAWTPATIGLMVLGFIVFWPLGVAMLAYILWGDRFDEFKSKMSSQTDEFSRSWRNCGHKKPRHHARTGNAAFDDWRDAELKRIEEQRRKLDEMRREFDSYLRELRRARDQQEFDAFMAARRSRNDNSGPSVPEVNGGEG